MKQSMSQFVFTLIIISAGGSLCQSAEIPDVAGNVSSNGFTRLDFCYADESLYAFNGLTLYRYDANSDSFLVVFGGVGAVIEDKWDPADFAFLTDSNIAVLPTGLSMKVVTADVNSQIAEEKTALARNYYSVASRFRDDKFFANGLGSSMNTIYLVDTTGPGSETEVVEVSNKNSGAIAFDAADNLYVADFYPILDGNGVSYGLGKIDIYRISRAQLDEFADDANYTVTPQLLVNDAILAGSDSMVIDADYNIYIGSYVGLAKLTPTAEANDFNVIEVDGDIYANPYGFPWPDFVFSGITADVRSGTLYYGKSRLNEQTYQYESYLLQSISIEPVVNWPGDLDGDGIVNGRDLELLISDYFYNGDYLKGDLDRNNYVDLMDFAVFTRQWLDTAPWYRHSN